MLRNVYLLIVILVLGSWCLTATVLTQKTLNSPHLGVIFAADIPGKAAVVTNVQKGSPADLSGLKVDDRVVAFRNNQADEWYEFTGYEAIAGRHQLHSHEMSTAAGHAIVKVWEVIKSGPIELRLDDGDVVHITPNPSRNITQLPAHSLATGLESLGIILIAVGIFAFARATVAVHFLAISGLGLSTVALTNTITGTRELAVPLGVVEFIHPLNGVGGILFTYGLLCVLWHYPIRIGKFPFAIVAMSFGLFTFLVSYFKWFEFPAHTYQLPNLLPFPIAIIISIVQWMRTRNQPVERASVLWFMLSIYGTTSLVVLLYSIPVFMKSPPIIGPHSATAVLALTYFGIALGTLRVRLFDVHRVWWRAILWFAGGVFVFMADILLVTQFQLEQRQAIPIALFIAGWLYFPIRQGLFRIFVGSRDIKVADQVSDMINTFSTLTELESFGGRYVSFMKRVFMAAEIGKRFNHEPSTPQLENNGLVLLLPNLSGKGGFELVGKFNGTQLFSHRDVATASTLMKLVCNLYDARVRENNTINDERERIVRDLHDDVGGRLLSLIYNTEDPRTENEARATLSALKETLIVIEDQQSADFSVWWAKIVAEAVQRVSDAKLDLRVKTDILVDRVLSARECVNLTRTVQEITTNAIKYSNGGPIYLDCTVDDDGEIVLSSENHVNEDHLHDEPSGRGITNMKRRISDIGGKLTTTTTNDEGKSKFSLTAIIPISDARL